MQVVGVGRALWLTGLLAVCALSLVLNLRWVVSGAYAHFAQEQLRFDDNRPAVRQAALLAQELDFRNAQALQLQAQNDLNAGQTDTALAEYRQALQLAPADAFLWRDYALAQLESGHNDLVLKQAVIHAQTLAPKSAPLQLSLALAGLKVYAQSAPDLQARWLDSIRFAYLYQPRGLLFAAYVAGQDLMLCQQVVPQSAHNPWCIQARWRHGLCQSQGPDSCLAQSHRGSK